MSTTEPNSDYDLQIRIEADVFPVEPDRLDILVRKVLRQFEILRASVEIVIVDDAAIAQFHQHYLGRRECTDVLSFDLSDDHQPQRIFEILVNAQEAVRQAEKRGHRPQAELALYIVHGLLHQLGYDDQTDSQARCMHRMEDQILQEHGYGKVYDRPSNHEKTMERNLKR